MQQFDFLKNKYGKELLVDLGRIESLKNYVLSPDLHCISFYEVLIITEGQGHYSLDGKTLPFQRGTVVVTLPYQIRQWRVEGAVEGFTFFFEGEFLNTYFRDEVFLNRFAIFDYGRPGIGLQLRAEQLQKYLWVIAEVEQEFRALKGDSSHIFRSLLYYSISLLDRFYREAHQIEKREQHPHLLYFKRLLDQHIHHWHTVAEYAQALGISHNQLNRICKENLLDTALHLIHQRLLLEAQREIRFGTKTISEVANYLHFSDVSNFNRFFKKMSGYTPRQYKRNLIEESEN